MLYYRHHITLDVYIQFEAKISTSLNVAVSASFIGHTVPLGIFGFFDENQCQDFWDFFT